jgi:crotonobetainyl-CoA:carnitine CoA-transferase CaiB-like acyl-CoA transferase
VLDAFADVQASERGMRVVMPAPQLEAGSVSLVGNPLHFSESPVRYRRPPPRLGEHAQEILHDWLGAPEQQTA